ncbi:hypothetical protein RDI58_017607 [Solanum bulbocastanum]|uniref:UBN2 domain-containing protein n=1 Tax=Solanum bulbocastanum TaxID=147425 RepID=A0AAN8YC61_SOLBU
MSFPSYRRTSGSIPCSSLFLYDRIIAIVAIFSERQRKQKEEHDEELHRNQADSVTKVPKERKERDTADKLAIQNNVKAKKILICSIGPDEYNRISSCQDAKAIWKMLQTAHEGTIQVKKSKIDNLNRQYEMFRMTEGETIQDMHIRFTAIINEIYSLGEIIPNGKAMRKLLSILPESWESKFEAITKAMDLKLIGNLMTYELKKNQEKEIGGKRKEKSLVLKATT